MEHEIELTDDQRRRLTAVLRNPPEVRLFTVRHICDRFGIAPRTVRYAIDKGLVPAEVFGRADQKGAGFGVTRQFSEFSAFMIGLAGVTLEAAVTGPLVSKIMRILLDWAGRNMGGQRAPALRAFLLFRWARHIVLEIGEGKAVRVIVRSAPAEADEVIPSPNAMPWMNIESKVEQGPEFAPVVTVQMDLARLLNKLR